ncbi:MAG: RagB/SusD family nutrient uptake outer membrane protein, partial [Chitinophaga rupis]
TDVGVPMGDEVAAVDNYFSSADARNQRLFRWDSIIYDPGIYAGEMSSLMTTLYLYNKIINEVMNSTGGADTQKKEILAEAKANRAYNNFWLINMYGKPYNSATAANDPGYPIVTAADVTQNAFTRASVQAMYDFILQDLTSAIPDLSVVISSRGRIGKAAAEMLLGKVYVFMGRYADAKTQLDASVTDLASTGSGTILTTMGLYDLNVTMVPGGTWGYTVSTATTYFTAQPAAANYTENIHCRSFLNYWSFTNSECVLTPQAAALYTSSDKRLNYFTSKPYLVNTGYPVAGVLRRNSPLSTPNGETIAELYLLRAECEARLND